MEKEKEGDGNSPPYLSTTSPSSPAPSSDTNSVTNTAAAKIHQVSDGHVKFVNTPPHLTTTFEEQRKFAERLRKFRTQALGVKQHIQRYQEIGLREKASSDGKNFDNTTSVVIGKTERVTEVRKVHINTQPQPVLKRSLPSSSSIDQVESDEIERAVRQKLIQNMNDIKWVLRSTRSRKQLSKKYSIEKNSPLYDFLSVSVCNSPKSTEPQYLRRGYSLPPAFQISRCRDPIENTTADSITNCLSCDNFWVDMLHMESESTI